MAGESGRVPVAALDDLAASAPARTDAATTFADLTTDRGPEPAPVARLDAVGPAVVDGDPGADEADTTSGAAPGGAAGGAGAPVAFDALAAGAAVADRPEPAPVADLELQGAPAGVAPAGVASLDIRPPRRAGGSAAPGDAARPGRSRRAGAGPAEGFGRSRAEGAATFDGAGAAGPRPDADPDPDADPRAVAREICLRLLTDRARTRQELAQALRRRGVPEDAAAAVLGRFDEVGLIDDAAFAERWVRSRHAVRGLGRRVLAVELRRKGVADELAGEALGTIDRAAEERRARELVDRRLRSARADTPEQRAALGRRLVGMLARKGYPAGVAYTVVRDALAEHGAEPDEFGADIPED